VIPQTFIDDLLNRLDIVEVIDKRVKLKKSGKNYSACCPFHNEKTPSFSVSPDKQFYYCFGCGASGTALGFLIEFERLSFPEAVESLARTAGLEVPREESSPRRQQAHRQQKSLYDILGKASNYYAQQLREHPQRQVAVRYLQNRGLSGTIARSFGMGYAPPGWDNLLVKLGLNEEDRNLLVESGLIIERDDDKRHYDRFRQRIMFPILDTRGRTIGFGGRVLDDSKPKYLNSPETPVFHKGRELYGLYQARQANRNLERLLVVEGYMDVIALAQFGISNAVATLGTACGEEHLRLAFRYTTEVVFCFDGDNAGRTAAKRALENALPAMEDGRQVKFLFLPEGQDPDSLVRQIGAERLERQLEKATPLEEFLFEAAAEGINVQTMEGRARLSKTVAPLINRLPNGIFRELMFNSLAKRTGLSLDLLQDLMHARVSLVPELQPPSVETPDGMPEPPPLEQAFVPPEDLAGHERYAEPYADTHSRPPVRTAPVKRAVNLTPARMATILLLDQPKLLQELDNTSLPDAGDDPQLALLHRLVTFLKDRPQATFNAIIGHWGGKYGVGAQQELVALVANQFLGSATQFGSYNALGELRDCLEKLRQTALQQQQRAELARLQDKRPSELTDAEKARIRELLQARLKSGKKAT
jgi:DNA primase